MRKNCLRIFEKILRKHKENIKKILRKQGKWEKIGENMDSVDTNVTNMNIF
jgi:hypothetical protein